MQTPHDDLASLVAFYGDPRSNLAAWEAAHLVPVIPPWQMFYGRIAVKSIQFHKLAAPALSGALAAIWTYYGQDQAKIQAIGMHNYSGAFNFRTVRGATSLSCHAFGAAIDFDAEHEAMNTQHISHMAQPVIDAFKAQGAMWGGDFHSRQDPMHFQFAHE